MGSGIARCSMRIKCPMTSHEGPERVFIAACRLNDIAISATPGEP